MLSPTPSRENYLVETEKYISKVTGEEFVRLRIHTGCNNCRFYPRAMHKDCEAVPCSYAIWMTVPDAVTYALTGELPDIEREQS